MSRSTKARKPLVWLVDDSPTERMVTERTLGDIYEYERFDDGAEAVERLSSGARQPDVLVLDWVMPGMAGDEVCRFVRANPLTRELPIILLTASRIETKDVVEGLASGANDYVARPYATEELRARVQSVLRARQLSKEAARERNRLATVNLLGRTLLDARGVERILDGLATILTDSICDGCSIMLIPGAYPGANVVRHRIDPTGELLSAISSIADPAIHAFESSEDALAKLPPAYHGYIRRFGMMGLAILPLPVSAPVQGVVTVSRDRDSEPFDDEDIHAIETCIDYVNLALQNALRFDAERVAREQLHTVLENLPIGIVVTDARAVVTLVNATASQLIPGLDKQHTLAALYRHGQWSSVSGQPIAEVDWAFGRALDMTLAARSELVYQATPTAAPRIFAISTVPLRDGRNAPAGRVAAIDDVTDQRAIGAERERIANFQEQMLGIVGHDLRTPLAAIVAGAESLTLRAREFPAIETLAKRIDSSAERMIRIVDQLLDVTRARLGTGIPVRLRPMELVAVARSVIEESMLAYPTSTFEVVAAHAEVHGVWDPDRLGQVVANLAGNAAQYGLPGSPITVEIGASEAHATITVRNALRDTPIAPETLDVLFDPYQRGRDTSKHASGLGLGLYIVHEIIRAHGGTIRAESNVDGTTFRVELPR